MKRIIMAMLSVLVVLTGQGQEKCHIEGELRDTTRGKTVVIRPRGVDIRVSDKYITVKAESKRLYLSRMDAMQEQVEAELKFRAEELQAKGKRPEEDSLLMKRYRECMDEYKKLFKEYRAWERTYYATHPMQYALL